jgi:ComF family protein
MKLNFGKEVIGGIIDVIFPRHCIVCSEVIFGKHETHLCLYCQGSLPLTYFKLGTQNAIEKTFWGRCNVVSAGSFFYYNANSHYANILKELKYHGNKSIGIQMGSDYGYWLKKNSPEIQSIELIIPVPLHEKKLKKRGYNQAECVAIGLAKALDIKVSTSSLLRLANKKTQTKKNRIERLQNAEQIYSFKDLIGKVKHIALVDDVITTGATIESCILAIHKVKNIKITVLSLAYTN